MLKKITLFLFMVFNLNIFSQVVIKDEIVLDEDDSPDAETLTMPFYGKIIGYVNSNCYEYCGLKLVTIKANGQLVERVHRIIIVEEVGFLVFGRLQMYLLGTRRNKGIYLC